MPVYNLSNVLGMSNDNINSMFANPNFDQAFGQMFSNNANMYSGIGNLFTNNPTFKAAFQNLMGSQNWQQPSGPSQYSGGGGAPSGVTVGAGGGGDTSGALAAATNFGLPTANFANAPPTYTGPGASPVQLTGGQAPNYASMFQPPSLYDMSNNGQGWSMFQNAPQAPTQASGPYDPTSYARFSTQIPVLPSNVQNVVKPKSPTIWETLAPIAGAALSLL